MLLNVPEIGISSHYRIYLLMTGSTFSIIHVFDRDATVKCHDILGRTYRLYSRSLFFGCKARGETRALIGGGGCEYSYIRVLPDEFLLKLTLMTADFKRNSSSRTRRYEHSPLPPINALVSPLCKGARSISDISSFNYKRNYF